MLIKLIIYLKINLKSVNIFNYKNGDWGLGDRKSVV